MAHCYQNVEIDEVVHFVGDSLYLSQMAAKTDADIIVCGGLFYGRDGKNTFSLQKKVLLPRMESGCNMADMINLQQLREFKRSIRILRRFVMYPTAEVKSECDMCCTSSNAVKIVESLGVKEVLFCPDTYLGKWVESKLEGVKVITYSGYCPTHLICQA